MGWTVRAHHHVRAAFRTLPREAAATAVAVASLWWLVAPLDDDLAARCFFSAVLAVPLLYSVSIAGDRLPVWLSRCLAALAVAAAAGLGATGAGLDEAFAWRFGLGLLAASMLPFVAVAAAAPLGERRVRFGDFVRRFTEQTTASGLVWGAAIIAVAVLFGSIEELFGIRRVAGVRLDDLRADAAAAITGACVLGTLHRLLPAGAPGRVPDIWRHLVSRVAAPFLVAMLAILAVYEVWAVARGALPVNMLSPLIVAAGAIGFASTLVVESLVAVRTERTLSPADPHRWAVSGPVGLSRAFAAVLLALLPLAVWALAIRIDQHGLTPLRAARMYALGCLGLLALWGTVRWIRRRPPLTWEVPACAAITALLAAVGPLSVVGLSIGSQRARLGWALDAAGVTGRVPAAAPVEVDADQAHEIADRIAILAALGGADATSPVITGDVGPCAERWDREGCFRHLGIAVPRTAGDPPRVVHVNAPAERVVAGFHSLDVSLRPGIEQRLGERSLSLRGNALVSAGDPVATADLSPLVARWLATRTLANVPPLLDQDGCARGHLLARSARIEEADDGPRIADLDGVWLVPIAPACDRGPPHAR